MEGREVRFALLEPEERRRAALSSFSLVFWVASASRRKSIDEFSTFKGSSSEDGGSRIAVSGLGVVYGIRGDFGDLMEREVDSFSRRKSILLSR